MNQPGDQELVRARTGLLDAIQALEPQLESLILVGAQAIYLHTQSISLPVAATTSDADIVFDPDLLLSDPTVGEAMTEAGFVPNSLEDAVGSWVSSSGVPIDLMVPVSIGGTGRRSVSRTPHEPNSIRKTIGLECCVFDSPKQHIFSNEDSDDRNYLIRVASPAALLVAKLIKFGERLDSPRFVAKDAYDIYRLMLSSGVGELAGSMAKYLGEIRLRDEVLLAVKCLEQHFAISQNSPGAESAASSEELIGQPDQVRARTWALSRELVASLADSLR